MVLHHIALLDRGGRLLLSQYLTPAAPGAQDRWEATLAETSRAFWPAALAGADVPLVLGERFVLLRARADVLFLLTGSGVHDELGLLEPADAAVAAVREACDGAPTPDRALAAHGKLRVIFGEMFAGGMLIWTDVQMALRNAKLKPPTV
jgi:hypothetical protein